MLRKPQGLRRTASQKKVKLLKPQTSALKMSKRVNKTLPKDVAQVVGDVFSKLGAARGTRLARAPTKASLSSSSAGASLAVGTAVIAALVVMLLVLTFLIWGIVRSGQAMSAGSADFSASKLYFWFMVGLSITYVVLNVTASAVAPTADDVNVTVVKIMSGSTVDAALVTQEITSRANAAKAMYGLSAPVGLAVLIMSIIALARLGLKQK